MVLEEEEEDSKVFSQRGNGFGRPADRGRVSGVRCARAMRAGLIAPAAAAASAECDGGRRGRRDKTLPDAAAAVHRPISSLSAPLSAARSPRRAVLLAWVSREMKFRNLCLSAGGASACLQGNASG